ncbi:MAG TPA: amidase [Acidimicrobiales bacterium]
MTDVRTDSATALVAALAAGEVSSSELLDAHLERYERWNGEINAVVATDLARARQRAAEADAATARGERWGPLHGLPITVKDSFETEGLVTTSGAPELADHVPEADARAVANLKAAGAIVWGKTNLPLYAGDWQSYNAVYGLSRNPWDRSRTVGGSSGAAAAAVASGITALELGSDIGGSIRVPSHFNGTFGHKPTWGAVSGRGHIPGPPGSLSEADLGVMGPIGRSAADMELAMDVLTSGGFWGIPGARLPPARPSAVTLGGCRIGLWLDDPACPVGAQTARLLADAAEALEGEGAQLVTDARTRTPLSESHLVYKTLLYAAMAPGFPAHVIDTMRAIDTRADPDDPMLSLARAMTLGHTDWLRLHERRLHIRAEWLQLFESVDVVLAPIAPVPAFPHDTDTPIDRRVLDVDGDQRPYASMLVWPGLATLPLLPATAVPVGRTDQGLPVGLQIVGPPWGDRTTIAVAGHLEGILGGFTPPPEP